MKARKNRPFVKALRDQIRDDGVTMPEVEAKLEPLRRSNKFCSHCGAEMVHVQVFSRQEFDAATGARTVEISNHWRCAKYVTPPEDAWGNAWGKDDNDSFELGCSEASSSWPRS